MKDKKILAYIGARGGSKGLPGKNIKMFCGKPLIAWTIEAALSSRSVTEVVVSTDSEEIASVAKDYGAYVPFIRPDYLATDSASAHESIKHCMHWIDNNRSSDCYDHFMLLHPTCPLRNNRHIDEAVDQYIKLGCQVESLVSVVKAPNKAAWLMKMNDHFIDFVLPVDVNNVRRQESPVCYYPNGAIYISSWENAKKNFFYGGSTIPYVMPYHESVDIDSIEDFIEAEEIFNKYSRLSLNEI